MRASFPFLFTGIGGDSGPQGEYLYLGSFANSTAADAYYDTNGLTKREGDYFTDQDEVGTVQKSWNGTDSWNYFMIFWDGISSGQLFADLPSITNEAYAFVGASVYKHNGIDEWVLQYVADGAKERAFYAEGGGVDSAMAELPTPVDSPRYALIYDSNLDQFGTAIFNGSLWLASSIQDGSLERPYQVNEASVSNVIAALSIISPVTVGMYANVVLGSNEPVLLQYDDTDGEWYEPNGGHGTELVPYWSALTSDDGIDALPAPRSGAYAVLGKGTGSPFRLRGLNLINGTATAVFNSAVAVLDSGLIRWVNPDIYALGTPTTVVGYIKSTSAGTVTVGGGTGGAINYDSAVAGRVAIKASTTTSSSIVSSVSRTTSTSLALIASRAKAANVASGAGGGSVYFRCGTTSDTNQFLGVIAGNVSSASGTNWAVWTGTSPSTYADTGILATSEKHLEATLNVSSNALNFYSDFANVLTTTSTSLSALGGMMDLVAAFTGGLNTTLSFTECLALEW